ncbi:efflux RND transporter periplasmic adaptor subunit [Gloeobacter kilaueensis]|uniref:RND family efflux transporter MFP subunit n=1 Tax=Gloeobacter kilaueensis (strain ATCC BAA-2537 / CCAP 1431/1 / ULC 316 / JS1) TaxID=1183438 RepID=U5QNY4_GLOK1|nr:efflux RND transporter periplasmic adaptor subunit [Gloeobacter kilaueensis]AGY60651.1 RND family efflux transporter MFP subunit [Gloeobacter kilaueensis JS1]
MNNPELSSAEDKSVRTVDPAGHAEPSLPMPEYTRQKATPNRQWLALAISLLVIGGGAWALHARTTAPPTKPATPVASKPQPVVTVTTARARYVPLDRTLEVTGSISAWDPLSIGAEASGLRIDQVLVEEGDRVRRGQTLVVLNDQILRAQLAQAEARHATDNATTAQRRAALIKAEATAREAQANLERYQSLGKQGAISAQEVLARQTTAQSTQADLDTARLAVNAAQATAQESTGQIAQIRAQLAQTRILAPDDGLIARRDARLGQIVSSGTALFMLVRDNRLELRAQVPEVDLPKVAPRQTVLVTSDADSRIAVSGRVRQITPQVDERTRLGTVRIDVPSVSGLRPGMFVRGRVELGSYQALVVPAQAVLTSDDSAQVFVLDGEQADSRTVVTGARSGDNIEVKSGLKPGERVIVAGAGYLKDGDYVRLPKSEQVAGNRP